MLSEFSGGTSESPSISSSWHLDSQLRDSSVGSSPRFSGPVKHGRKYANPNRQPLHDQNRTRSCHRQRIDTASAPVGTKYMHTSREPICFSFGRAKFPRWFAVVSSCLTLALLLFWPVDVGFEVFALSTPIAASSVTQLFTYQLVHGNLAHCGINMISILAAGSVISSGYRQRVLVVAMAIGAIQFALVWILTSPLDQHFLGSAPTGYVFLGMLCALLAARWRAFTARARALSLFMLLVLIAPSFIITIVEGPPTDYSMALYTCFVTGMIVGFVTLQRCGTISENARECATTV